MSEDSRRIAREGRRAMREGPDGIARSRRTHLAEIVAYAREHSPFYRELYAGLPERVEDPTLLPVTDKRLLMSHFDDWVTDREVRLDGLREFVADPGRMGEPYLGRYLVATTSGTSGLRGVFLSDEHVMTAGRAIGRRATSGLGARDLLKLLAHGARTAIVSAPTGHFFTVASVEWYRRRSRVMRRIMRVFPTGVPLPELVDRLNRYDPAGVSGFLGMITLLAGEQEAGRLRIHPASVIVGGETVSADVLERIGAAFGAKVRASYAATECGFLSYTCDRGWYHVNGDWAVLEPVDAEYRPVPAGTASQTVLISNLANRVQPVLRYDLGDSVLMRPDPCECGSPLPAVRVQGRAAEPLIFDRENGEPASISPMLLGTALDRVPGLGQYQVVQTGPSTLRVRMTPAPGAEAGQVWRSVRDELTRLLTGHNADHVTLEHAEEPPQRSPGGKYRRLIPLGSGESRAGEHDRR